MWSQLCTEIGLVSVHVHEYYPGILYLASQLATGSYVAIVGTQVVCMGQEFSLHELGLPVPQVDFYRFGPPGSTSTMAHA